MEKHGLSLVWSVKTSLQSSSSDNKADSYFVPKSLVSETPRLIRLNLYALTQKDMDEVASELSKLNAETNIQIDIQFKKNIVVSWSDKEWIGQDKG